MTVTDEKKLYFSHLSWKEFEQHYIDKIKSIERQATFERSRTNPDIFCISEFSAHKVSADLKLMKIKDIIQSGKNEYNEYII